MGVTPCLSGSWTGCLLTEPNFIVFLLSLEVLVLVLPFLLLRILLGTLFKRKEGGTFINLVSIIVLMILLGFYVGPMAMAVVTMGVDWQIVFGMHFLSPLIAALLTFSTFQIADAISDRQQKMRFLIGIVIALVAFVAGYLVLNQSHTVDFVIP